MYALVIVFLVSTVPPQIEVAMHGVSLFFTQTDCERQIRALADTAQALHPAIPVRAACVKTEMGAQ